MLAKQELKAFLDEKSMLYEKTSFIDSDPIQIPSQFKEKQDIEISGFLTSIIAWGNRKSIIKNANKMMVLMGEAPFDFVISHREKDLERLEGFVHRTFNAIDFKYFIKSLKNIYVSHGGLEQVFSQHVTNQSVLEAISHFKKVFFDLDHPRRTRKHISDPCAGSAAKRINMFLRWMVRGNSSVDFGLWHSIKSSDLSCPLDVHSGNVARKLGLLQRNQNDFKAVQELDSALRALDPNDPVKYDFALFGLGVFENF